MNRWENEKVNLTGFYKLASEKTAFVRRDAAHSMGSTLSEEGERKERGVQGEKEVKVEGELKGERGVKGEREMKDERGVKDEREVKGESNIESEQAGGTENRKPAFDLLRLTGDRDNYVKERCSRILCHSIPLPVG